MKKLASLSNGVLLGIAGLFLVMVYLLAIQPTQKLYEELNELQSLEANNSSPLSNKGNVKELEKLEQLLAQLHPQQNLQATVLNAVGKNAVKLKSFREEKIEEQSFGGEKNLKKYVLLVSGTYKNLLALSGSLNEFAISSSSFYINEEQEELLNLNILVKGDINK